MATVSKGRVFVSGETVTPAKLNELVDSATVTAIQTADISDSAVTDAKIASGVDASKLTAGTLPADRIGSNAITTARINDAAVTQAKLASNVAGNGPIFRAEVSSATAVADNTWTKINVQSEVFDSNSNFASSRFTPTVAGYYFINGSVDASGAAKVLTAGLYKNGTVRFATGDHHGDTTASWISNVSGTLYLNGTTDYIELWAYHNNGNSRNIGTDFNRTFLEGFLVRAA